MTFVTSEFERSVGAQIGAVNRALIDALRAGGFSIGSQTLTRIEARRGSKVACALVGALALRKIPMVATARLEPGEGSCTLSVQLADAWSIAYGQATAVKEHYRAAFADVQAAIDAALARVSPNVGGGASVEWSSKRTSARLTGIAGWLGRTGDEIANRGESLIAGEGLRRAKRLADEIESVRFDSPAGAAVLGRLDVQAMLDVGALIATHPGALPPSLAADVERFLARLETSIAAGDVSPLVLAGDEVDVLRFLRQQALLRTRVPVRTLQECTSCHSRRVINPDYQRIVKRNGFLKGVGGSFGAGLIRGHVAPFVLFSRVLGVAKLDPNFVCRTCQGMEADERLVALCPHCGTVLATPVLTACTKCRHDLRADLPREALWRAAPETPLAGTPADWLEDPTHRHRLRYWDGQEWTAHVADDGLAITDPI